MQVYELTKSHKAGIMKDTEMRNLLVTDDRHRAFFDINIYAMDLETYNYKINVWENGRVQESWIYDEETGRYVKFFEREPSQLFYIRVVNGRVFQTMDRDKALNVEGIALEELDRSSYIMVIQDDVQIETLRYSMREGGWKNGKN